MNDDDLSSIVENPAVLRTLIANMAVEAVKWRTALEDIRDKAPAAGEDVSFQIAITALGARNEPR